MEINDIIRLMQAVSENGLTSFKLEEGNLKISLKKEEIQQIVAGNGMASGMAAALPAGGFAAGMAANMLPVGETAGAGTSSQNGVIGNTADSQSNGGSIDSDKVVASPLVGTFYNASSPEAEAFVKVGDTVKKGQTLGIIEAMKLMNEIESEYDGVVEAVLVSNEDVVEYGQPLFRIR